MSAAAELGPLPHSSLASVSEADDSQPVAYRRAGLELVGFDRSMPADSKMIAAVRAEFRAWLTACGVGSEDQDALVLACSETIANSIEHAYRGDPSGIVQISGICDGRHVDVSVHDDGTWVPPRNRNPEESGLIRGRGLPLIGRLMDATELNMHDGTTIKMRRRLRHPRNA